MNPRLRSFLMISFSMEIALSTFPAWTRIPAVMWGGAIAVVAGLGWGILASEVGMVATLVYDNWVPFLVTDLTFGAEVLLAALVICVLSWACLRGRLAPYSEVWASLREREEVRRDG